MEESTKRKDQRSGAGGASLGPSRHEFELLTRFATLTQCKDSDSHEGCQGFPMSYIRTPHVHHVGMTILTQSIEEGTGFEPANASTLPSYELSGLSHSPTPPSFSAVSDNCFKDVWIMPVVGTEYERAHRVLRREC